MKGGDITQTPYFTGHTTCLLSDVLVIHMLTVNVKTCHFSAAGVFLSASGQSIYRVYISLVGCALCSVAICGTHKTNVSLGILRTGGMGNKSEMDILLFLKFVSKYFPTVAS